MINIAVFASGSGSNAQAIIEYFKGHRSIRIGTILSNNPKAFVLERAKKHQIPSVVFTKGELNEGKVLEILKSMETTFIVLAGFLMLIPNLVENYAILNIHPALLPKYGGKGMYGMKVHEAVKKAGDTESGMTIHIVDENYDEGKILFQESCRIDPADSADQIASKVLVLEHKNYPLVIEEFAVNNYKN